MVKNRKWKKSIEVHFLLVFATFFYHVSFNLSLFHMKQLLVGNTIVHKLMVSIIACVKVIA